MDVTANDSSSVSGTTVINEFAPVVDNNNDGSQSVAAVVMDLTTNSTSDSPAVDNNNDEPQSNNKLLGTVRTEMIHHHQLIKIISKVLKRVKTSNADRSIFMFLQPMSSPNQNLNPNQAASPDSPSLSGNLGLYKFSQSKTQFSMFSPVPQFYLPKPWYSFSSSSINNNTH